MSERLLTNARVVTPDAVVHGTVVVDGGRIVAVDEGLSRAPGTVDVGGDYLLPGLVEIHTDNVEKHLIPRPGFLWPSPTAALLAHDVQMAGAGVTTVLDAVCVGDYDERRLRRELLASTVAAIKRATRDGMLRAEHLIHLRCEISDDTVVEGFAPYAEDPIVRLVSIMDHTPGQRQWRDLEKLRQFDGASMSDAEFEAMVQERVARASVRRESNRREVLDRWRPRGLPVASHDDTTEAHVAESVKDGIGISEFPTTIEAARKARAEGMAVVVGAPNVVRGESHSGNVSAQTLVAEGLADGLSSDYMPVSLLQAAFLVHDRLGASLPAAIAMASLAPARMLGLSDRGAIDAGMRADLVRVRRTETADVVREVWRAGARVA